MKYIYCDFCHDDMKVDKGMRSGICALCVQLLINQPQDKLLKAYNLAVEKGYKSKARAITSFLEVEEHEAKNTKRNMVRTRISRKARPSRNSIRA